ncbi:MAG TPA: glycosyltransferase family 9 protein [bacterium]|nr:glycosyltransferase family 9 protein [bacterium]
MKSIKSDCRHFRGDRPCGPHKLKGVHCGSCFDYEPSEQRVLIIKLGAIGDVLRTTPLLVPLRQSNPRALITWLTETPEILPASHVDRILDATPGNLEWLRAARFDWIINLDKDPMAIGLTETLEAVRKTGFGMDEWGRCRPLDDTASRRKWLTGLWDDVNRANRKHYMEEIFEMCGYSFKGEPYILKDTLTEPSWPLDSNRPKAGLNTGCGGRWKSRLWPEEYWSELAGMLMEDGYQVVLLGGAEEHEKNRRIANRSGADYFGVFDLKTFIHLVNGIDLMVTAVTMAMHVAIGLGKRLVLFNNIFNPHEFYLYDRGVILSPEMECGCYYASECPKRCMETLRVETARRAVHTLLPLPGVPAGGGKTSKQ